MKLLAFVITDKNNKVGWSVSYTDNFVESFSGFGPELERIEQDNYRSVRLRRMLNPRFMMMMMMMMMLLLMEHRMFTNGSQYFET